MENESGGGWVEGSGMVVERETLASGFSVHRLASGDAEVGKERKDCGAQLPT